MKIELAAGLLAVTLASGGAARAQSPPAVAPPASSPSPAPPLPAGLVPASVDVELAGTVTPAFVLAHVRAAIDAQAQREPGTSLDIHGITVDANLAPGTKLDALAGVAIGGRGTYGDVNGKTSVHVAVADLPAFDPAQLLYSDDPEYIPAGVAGVLLRGTVAPDAPVRLFLYHVAADTPRRVSLVLQTTGAPARVQLLGSVVAPNPAYAYTGQQTTARFLSARASQESTLVDVAPDVPLELPLGTLQPGDLIEAVDDLRVVSGGTVTLSLITSPASPADIASLLAGPELADDSHNRRGAYAIATVPPIDLHLTVGAPDPDPVRAGTIDLPNLRPGGRSLGGDYGIVRRLSLELVNPSAQPQTAYLWERTLGGGGATVTIRFDGEAGATMIPCVNDAVQPRLVRAFELAPGSAQSVVGSYMTDGASSYPIEFGLSLTAPLAIEPGACDGIPKSTGE